MNYNKVCELEDFDALNDAITAIFPQYVEGGEHRKYWEVAQTVRAIEDHTNKRKKALGVGAGTEPTIFYLTGVFAEVHAVDLYAGGGWKNVAPENMLTAPEQYSGGLGDVSKLTVQHMDARALRYADNTFDAVFCTSAIEHFGDWSDMAKAAAEMGRVLKPGGVLVIVTEYDLNERGGQFNANGYCLNREQIANVLWKPSGCTPVDEPSYSASDITMNTAQLLSTAIALDLNGQPPQLPHIVLVQNQFTFTSFSLVMQKEVSDG